MSIIREVFEDIYQHKKWGKTQESVSGSGSSLQTTRKLRQDLPALCQEMGIQTLLDAPCGDVCWVSHIDWKATGVSYTGMDIVPDLILRNKVKMPHAKFVVGDICKDDLPPADMMMVRDCLVHLPYEMIQMALDNIARSPIKYLLTTTFPGRTNKDIRLGDWRPIDLEGEPFNLTPPLRYLEDYYADRQFSDKKLGIWEVSSMFCR